MITLEKKRSENEYRALDVDSYSSLATFAKDRRQYYKKYYIGEQIEEEDENKAILMGTLVETLLLEGQEEFDNKFYMSITDKNPTPGVMRFINALYKVTLDNTNEENEVMGDFIVLAQQAFELAGIKKPGFKKFLEDFIDSDDELYYKQLRETKPMCKSIVSMQDIDNAEKIVKELRTNPITADIINQEDDDRYSVFNQKQVDGYELEGLPFKNMYDKIIGDHKNKWIQFYDLKCTWNVEEFYEAYYLYRRSDIQAYTYYNALMKRVVDLGFDYSDYEILPPKFIVVDSINYMSPLIYKCTSEDLENSYNGFYHKNKYYKGVKNIIKDLKWAKENNEWRISRENAETNGIVEFKKVR